MTTFGGRLRAARTAKGLTQLQLAQHADCDPTSISRAERDEVQPTLDLVRRFAKALGVSTDHLVVGDDVPRRRATA